MNKPTREQDTCAVALAVEDLLEVQGGVPSLGNLMALLAITCATAPKACQPREDSNP